jgi:hypothetical protein
MLGCFQFRIIPDTSLGVINKCELLWAHIVRSMGFFMFSFFFDLTLYFFCYIFFSYKSVQWVKILFLHAQQLIGGGSLLVTSFSSQFFFSLTKSLSPKSDLPPTFPPVINNGFRTILYHWLSLNAYPGLELASLTFLSQMIVLINSVTFYPCLLTLPKHFSNSDLILYLATSSFQSQAVEHSSSLIPTSLRFVWVMKTQGLLRLQLESKEGRSG